MKHALFAAALPFLFAAALPLAAQAQGDDDILSKVINVPLPSTYNVYGLRDKPGVRKDAAVQGGMALRVYVPAKGTNPWDVGLSSAVTKPVKAGDQLDLAFWARAEKGDNGATTVHLNGVGVALAKEPYTPIMSEPVTITPEWKLYEVKGKADRDYAVGELNVAMQLATGKQVIDIGPVFLLDLGPGS